MSKAVLYLQSNIALFLQGVLTQFFHGKTKTELIMSNMNDKRVVNFRFIPTTCMSSDVSFIRRRERLLLLSELLFSS